MQDKAALFIQAIHRATYSNIKKEVQQEQFKSSKIESDFKLAELK